MINSSLLMKILFVVNVVITILSILERNWVRGLYWLGASIVQISIVMMK